MLKSLISQFLFYLRRQFPTKYRQPTFMIDEEKAQVNALEALNVEFSIYRFHLVKCWRTHLTRKVKKEHQGDVAKCLLTLLVTQNAPVYQKAYNVFVGVCQNKASEFLAYFNREHHRLAKHWNLSCRCLRNNSLGSMNNITESAIRLHQQQMTNNYYTQWYGCLVLLFLFDIT